MFVALREDINVECRNDKKYNNNNFLKIFFTQYMAFYSRLSNIKDIKFVLMDYFLGC